jgi:putative methyltransferase (TIGR04325 family)
MMTQVKQLAAVTPIVRQWMARRYDRRFLENKSEQLYRGVFETSEEAVQSFPTEKTGYDNWESASMYDELSRRVESYDYPVLFWIKRIFEEERGQRNCRVFDYGGHVGIKYYAFGKLIQNMPAWCVCDVPAVVRRGRALAEARKAQLVFTDRFSEVAGSGILLCLGSLQYVPRTLPDLLSGLHLSKPRHVILNTTAVTDERTFFTLNSMGTSFCPYRVQNAKELVSGMSGAGYTLETSWENPGRQSTVPFQSDRGPFRYEGMKFRLTSA